MSETRAHHPTLHTVPLDHQPPELLASRCGECDYLAFPAGRFGCPSCGAVAESCERASIAGRGTLEVFTIVHRTFSRSFPAPYAVGTILLDAGTLTPPGESHDVRITRDAVSKAYDETALGPADLDVIELHEAFTIEEILYVEAMGLCAEGEGGPFTESRATWIGGDCAVNPSGGLLAMGHPFGPTGLGQIAEITYQLRGEAGDRQQEGARLGLAHMVGVGEVCFVHILSREG